MLQITNNISFDESELHEEFIRASGPGGQNVNKVATAVQLRFDVRLQTGVESFSERITQNIMERLEEKHICPNGDVWEIWLVVYATDQYAPGGSDEVIQYKKNGREVGHHTRHLDKDGRLLKENYHGVTTLPQDAKRV